MAVTRCLLLDFRKLYDSIECDILIGEALDLGFPPLLLCLAMAELQGSNLISPKRGALQGCPL